MGPAILVHGGAGDVHPDDDPRALMDGCLRAARAGYELLRTGKSALDAVEAAASMLEDDPLFNAGTGAALNAEGEVELDASIMDGATLGAGAVAALRHVKNPIQVAREVMQRTSHVLLTGEGAQRFAREVGSSFVPMESLITERTRARFDQARATRRSPRHGGTIGAVALDARGHVAAATSTGGTLLKRPGRVGDSPLVGAGTYADDESGAASATGLGEAIIKVALCKSACDLLRQGLDPNDAARRAIRLLDRVRGEAGLILVDMQGRLGVAYNTARMSRAFIDAAGSAGAGFD